MKKEITITLEPTLASEGEHNYRITKLVNTVTLEHNGTIYRIEDVISEKVADALTQRPWHKVITSRR